MESKGDAKTVREYMEEMRETSLQILKMKDEMMDILFEGDRGREADIGPCIGSSSVSVVEKLREVNDFLLCIKKDISEMLSRLGYSK